MWKARMNEVQAHLKLLLIHFLSLKDSDLLADEDYAPEEEVYEH
jgi:hypothetical protein